MASLKAMMENKRNGFQRKAPLGFSWTTLFFSGIPAAMRGHWGMAFLQWFLFWVTAGLSWLVFPFIYNRIYFNSLINDGYTVDPETPNFERVQKKAGIKIKK